MSRWRRSALRRTLHKSRGTIAYVIVVVGVLAAYLYSIKGCAETRSVPEQPKGPTIILETR